MKKGPKTVSARTPPPRASSGPAHPTWVPVVISAASSAAGPPGKSGRLASCCFPGEEEKERKHRKWSTRRHGILRGGKPTSGWQGSVVLGRESRTFSYVQDGPSLVHLPLYRQWVEKMAPHSQASKCVCVCVCVYGLVAQSCPTLLDPMDCSLQGEPSNRPPDPPRGSPG